MSINPVFADLRAQKAKNYRTWMKSILSDGIISGCALTFTSTSITVGVGHFVASGGVVEIDVAETTNLLDPIANGYVRLKYQWDISQVPSSTVNTQGSFTYDYSATLAGFAALTKNDINAASATSGIYETEIAVYTMVSSNCTALVRSMLAVSSALDTDGWKSANDLTYVSATSATTYGDWTAKIRKGTKIRYKQGGAYKYNSVSASSYSAGTGLTTLTTHAGYVTTAGDCSFASAPISYFYYSNEENPSGFPGLFNYAPTYGGFSSNPTQNVRFALKGNIVTYFATTTANGTSNATTFTMSLPIAATQGSMVYGIVADNGVLKSGNASIPYTGGSTLSVYVAPLAAFASSGAKSADFIIQYQI